jgi:hypothetical protein
MVFRAVFWVISLTHPWWWRQYAPLKRRSTIILHGSITQKTALNILLWKRSSNVTSSGIGRWNILRNVRFQVFTAANMKMKAFWYTQPCSLVGVDRRFRSAYCVMIIAWWWRQYAPFKRLSTTTSLHGAIYQKSVVCILRNVLRILSFLRTNVETWTQTHYSSSIFDPLQVRKNWREAHLWKIYVDGWGVKLNTS